MSLWGRTYARHDGLPLIDGRKALLRQWQQEDKGLASSTGSDQNGSAKLLAQRKATQQGQLG
jgi:beta-phosphoglucomutase-like phosphatase (HAD superfamily)